MSLSTEEIETIAQRVAELIADRLQPPPTPRLLDAAQLAERLGVERDWVYAHAAQLGGVRLGGPKGRLRFDPDTVTERLDQAARPRLPAGSRRPGDGRPSTSARYHLQSRAGHQSGRAARQRPRP
jgi:hypothetical protein